MPDSPSDVSIVDADLSSVVTTAADKLIRVEKSPGQAGPYLAHVEFQSSADPALDARVLLYNVLGRRRHGLPVWSAVFLLRPQALAPGVTGKVSEHLAGVSRLDFSYQLVRVWELPTSLILTGGLGTLPLAPITALEAGALPPIISAVQQRLSAELKVQQRREMVLAMRVLMGLRFQDQILENLMQSISEMEDSVEWQKIFRLGENQGQIKGKLEGKLEGYLEAERTVLIRQGTVKFGPPPQGVINTLLAIHGTDALAELTIKLLNASSWDDLLRS